MLHCIAQAALASENFAHANLYFNPRRTVLKQLTLFSVHCFVICALKGNAIYTVLVPMYSIQCTLQLNHSYYSIS